MKNPDDNASSSSTGSFALVGLRMAATKYNEIHNRCEQFSRET